MTSEAATTAALAEPRISPASSKAPGQIREGFLAGASLVISAFSGGLASRFVTFSAISVPPILSLHLVVRLRFGHRVVSAILLPGVLFLSVPRFPGQHHRRFFGA